MKPLTRRKFASCLAVGLATLPAARGNTPRRATTGGSGGDLDKIAALTLAEASARISAGTITSTLLTRACLERIRGLDPKLNAFISEMGEAALQQAAQMDLEQRSGKLRGPLHGIPIALKDNIDTAGVRTTAGSQVYDARIPTEDAEVTRRLLAAGAILVGKTNLNEFGTGIGYYGPVRNPWKLDHDPSGSSSGSAAAVATNLAFGSLGTDTSGSIRMPAAYCGVVGLKPTYGLVPIRGIVPLLLSLDHCGPITRTVDDAALLLNALVGYDRHDITSVDHKAEDYFVAVNDPVDNIRLGIARAPFFDHLDADTSQCVEAAIRILEKLTRDVRDVTLPPAAGFDALAAEVYASQQDLFENDGHRYMLAFHSVLNSLKAGLDSKDDVCSTKVSAYIHRQWQLALLRRTIDEAFTNFDLVVLPTVRVIPGTLKSIIESQENPKPINPNVTYALRGANCLPFNIFGIPAISIPCGFSRDGLPIGLMIAGPRFSEGRIMALAKAYELRARWDEQRPPVTPNTPVPEIRDNAGAVWSSGG